MKLVLILYPVINNTHKGPLKILALVVWEDNGAEWALNKYLWVARFPTKKTENPTEPFTRCLAFVKPATWRQEFRTALEHKLKICQVAEVCRQLLASMYDPEILTLESAIGTAESSVDSQKL